jgi:hypothetical protein
VQENEQGRYAQQQYFKVSDPVKSETEAGGHGTPF